MGETLLSRFPFTEDGEPVTKNHFNAYINNVRIRMEEVKSMITAFTLQTWKATLCVVGQEGIPAAATAGNVMRPETSLRLSIRLPPTKNVEEAKAALIRILSENPPYGAEVTLSNVVGMKGWNCPETSKYLLDSIEKAS